MDLITVDLVTGISEFRAQAYDDYFFEYGFKLVGMVISVGCLGLAVGLFLRSKLIGFGFVVVLLLVTSSGVDRAIQKRVDEKLDGRYEVLRAALVKKDKEYLIYHANSSEVTARSRLIAIAILNEKHAGWELSSTENHL